MGSFAIHFPHNQIKHITACQTSVRTIPMEVVQDLGEGWSTDRFLLWLSILHWQDGWWGGGAQPRWEGRPPFVTEHRRPQPPSLLRQLFHHFQALELLLDRGVYSCGTTRPSWRGFPDDLKGLKLLRGEYAFRKKGSLVATVWRDKRDVTMLSTLTQPDSILTVKRRQPDGTTKEVQCPEVVVTYNECMSGVDN